MGAPKAHIQFDGEISWCINIYLKDKGCARRVVQWMYLSMWKKYGLYVANFPAPYDKILV
jgi:hypothetical protein